MKNITVDDNIIDKKAYSFRYDGIEVVIEEVIVKGICVLVKKDNIEYRYQLDNGVYLTRKPYLTKKEAVEKAKKFLREMKDKKIKEIIEEYDKKINELTKN